MSIQFANPTIPCTLRVASLGDGESIDVSWAQAYSTIPTNAIAYHIYYSGLKANIFSEGVKLVSFDGSLQANIIGLTPGQVYYICVRPVEYDPEFFNLNTLPIAHDNLRFYPSSMLREDISATDLIIPLTDVETFIAPNIVKIGEELVFYVAVDTVNNNLVVAGGTDPLASHLIAQGDGYYSVNVNNVGIGLINNLSLVLNPEILTENWTIKCVSVEQINGVSIPLTARFIAIGSISGVQRDGYSNPIVWISDNIINSGSVLSFSIQETATPFQQGDQFLVEVMGITPGQDSGRGYNGTTATEHLVSGFDGYNFLNPIISNITIVESDLWDRIHQVESRYEYPNFPFVTSDGYKQVPVDYLSTDLAFDDSVNVLFPEYPFAGWHRTDPVLLLSGICVGSYIGGQMGCIDAFGNFNMYRGLNLEAQNTQRQDVLLSVTGRSACLVKRQQTGTVCNCYLNKSEYQDDRCPFCYGTKFVFGYEQYFNPRSSDGRIMVRVGPTPENLKPFEGGLESVFSLDMWTLTVPTIHTRDFLILFDEDGNEEFRYEVMDVIRNQLILNQYGAQHLKTSRVRKTDPIYQFRAFRDTSMFPQTISTTLTSVPGALPFHSHDVQVNEHDPSGFSQTSSVNSGHNHPILITNGFPTLMEVLSHTHQIILP